MGGTQGDLSQLSRPGAGCDCQGLPGTPDPAFPFRRWQDPIFSLATPLRAGEEGSHSRKSLCRSREEPGPGDRGAPLSSAPILGGWFGRGCTKRTKRKKVT